MGRSLFLLKTLERVNRAKPRTAVEPGSPWAGAGQDRRRPSWLRSRLALPFSEIDVHAPRKTYHATRTSGRGSFRRLSLITSRAYRRGSNKTEEEKTGETEGGEGRQATFAGFAGNPKKERNGSAVAYDKTVTVSTVRNRTTSTVTTSDTGNIRGFLFDFATTRTGKLAPFLLVRAVVVSLHPDP